MRCFISHSFYKVSSNPWGGIASNWRGKKAHVHTHGVFLLLFKVCCFKEVLFCSSFLLLLFLPHFPLPLFTTSIHALKRPSQRLRTRFPGSASELSSRHISTQIAIKTHTQRCTLWCFFFSTCQRMRLAASSMPRHIDACRGLSFDRPP